MSTAIFGGTFDPVHNGHLAAARTAADDFQIDKVLFVPAGNPPHKRRSPEAEYHHRLRMVELACAEDPRFAASRLEEPSSAAGLHYSVDTIERLRRDVGPDERLFFVIGADAFGEFSQWRRRREVAREVEFLVVSRPEWSFSLQPLDEPALRTHYLQDVAIPISSTELRDLLHSGKQAAKWLPANVLGYIREHHLYGAA